MSIAKEMLRRPDLKNFALSPLLLTLEKDMLKMSNKGLFEMRVVQNRKGIKMIWSRLTPLLPQITLSNPFQFTQFI